MAEPLHWLFMWHHTFGGLLCDRQKKNKPVEENSLSAVWPDGSCCAC